MSIFPASNLQCNHCGRILHGLAGEYAKALRRRARVLGWRWTRGLRNMITDTCPECAGEGRG